MILGTHLRDGPTARPETRVEVPSEDEVPIAVATTRVLGARDETHEAQFEILEVDRVVKSHVNNNFCFFFSFILFYLCFFFIYFFFGFCFVIYGN